MSSLSYLDLSGNIVRSLTLNSFNRCRTLQHRKMAANLLVDIETVAIEKSDFYGTSRLTYLLRQENAIEFIESEAFITNALLRVLRLDGNQLRPSVISA
uniref:Uncharacterized protein n=1 Tax=Glossina palpalis gambiensis TaxID=67801 RepID=A0A1B0B0P8_9MUSC